VYLRSIALRAALQVLHGLERNQRRRQRFIPFSFRRLARPWPMRVTCQSKPVLPTSFSTGGSLRMRDGDRGRVHRRPTRRHPRLRSCIRTAGLKGGPVFRLQPDGRQIAQPRRPPPFGHPVALTPSGSSQPAIEFFSRVSCGHRGHRRQEEGSEKFANRRLSAEIPPSPSPEREPRSPTRPAPPSLERSHVSKYFFVPLGSAAVSADSAGFLGAASPPVLAIALQPCQRHRSLARNDSVPSRRHIARCCACASN